MGSHFDSYEKAAIERGKAIGGAAQYATTPEGQKRILRTTGYGLAAVPGVGWPAAAAMIGVAEGGARYIDTNNVSDAIKTGAKEAAVTYLLGKNLELGAQAWNRLAPAAKDAARSLADRLLGDAFDFRVPTVNEATAGSSMRVRRGGSSSEKILDLYADGKLTPYEVVEAFYGEENADRIVQETLAAREAATGQAGSRSFHGGLRSDFESVIWPTRPVNTAVANPRNPDLVKTRRMGPTVEFAAKKRYWDDDPALNMGDRDPIPVEFHAAQSLDGSYSEPFRASANYVEGVRVPSPLNAEWYAELRRAVNHEISHALNPSLATNLDYARTITPGGRVLGIGDSITPGTQLSTGNKYADSIISNVKYIDAIKDYTKGAAPHQAIFSYYTGQPAEAGAAIGSLARDIADITRTDGAMRLLRNPEDNALDYFTDKYFGDIIKSWDAKGATAEKGMTDFMRRAEELGMSSDSQQILFDSVRGDHVIFQRPMEKRVDFGTPRESSLEPMGNNTTIGTPEENRKASEATRQLIKNAAESGQIVMNEREPDAIHAAQKGGEGSPDYTAHSESTGPTDEQLQEAVEFLETVMEIGAPQNEWEQSIVQRTHDILKASIGMPRAERAPENPAPTDAGTGTQAAVGAEGTDDEEKPIIQESAGEYGVKEAVDYKDGDSWRTSSGQLIGDDKQYKEYQQAQKALEGTGAYYDNGVFRTKDGAKIGGDLGSVTEWANVAKATEGTGAYYSGGTWREQTGKRLDTDSILGRQDQSSDKFGQNGTQQSNGGEFARQNGTEDATRQANAEEPAQRTGRLTSREAEWQAQRRESTEAYLERKLDRERRRTEANGGSVSERTAGAVADLWNKYEADNDQERKIRGRDIRGNPIF